MFQDHSTLGEEEFHLILFDTLFRTSAGSGCYDNQLVMVQRRRAVEWNSLRFLGRTYLLVYC